MIDNTDKNIIQLLQKDGRTTNSEIARKLKLTPSAVLERVKKLRNKKIIQGFETRLDAEQLGLSLTSFISIKTTEKIGLTKIGERIGKLNGVQEVHFITGEFCYLLKVYVRDTAGLTRLMEKIGKIPGVTASKTILVLKSIKESLELDLDNAG